MALSMNGAVMSDDRGPACPNGWPIVDVERRNDDPWQNDDCWHRGAFTRVTVRGTNISDDERTSDGIGDQYDRFMRMVKDAGYVGHMWFIHSDYKCLQSNQSY